MPKRVRPHLLALLMIMSVSLSGPVRADMVTPLRGDTATEKRKNDDYEARQKSEGLDRLYQNCMGGESETSDPSRAQYCACLREKFMPMSLAEYAQIAAEQALHPSKPPEIVRALSEECMQEIINK